MLDGTPRRGARHVARRVRLLGSATRSERSALVRRAPAHLAALTPPVTRRGHRVPGQRRTQHLRERRIARAEDGARLTKEASSALPEARAGSRQVRFPAQLEEQREPRSMRRDLVAGTEDACMEILLVVDGQVDLDVAEGGAHLGRENPLERLGGLVACRHDRDDLRERTTEPCRVARVGEIPQAVPKREAQHDPGIVARRVRVVDRLLAPQECGEHPIELVAQRVALGGVHVPVGVGPDARRLGGDRRTRLLHGFSLRSRRASVPGVCVVCETRACRPRSYARRR